MPAHHLPAPGLPTAPSLCLQLPLVSMDLMGVLNSHQPQFSSKFSTRNIARTHPPIECKANYRLNFCALVLRCNIMNFWPTENSGGCVRQSITPVFSSSSLIWAGMQSSCLLANTWPPPALNPPGLSLPDMVVDVSATSVYIHEFSYLNLSNMTVDESAARLGHACENAAIAARSEHSFFGHWYLSIVHEIRVGPLRLMFIYDQCFLTSICMFNFFNLLNSVSLSLKDFKSHQ
ncbi:hypothetical protein DFH08DRAFT_827896 [Mycena albidolilacea]|uniref:Uncharacterized protein n=1 Tax=Mycena albidolilacea TaxID=1033008 RepID=A0AAD6YXL6_9AGAR|nr:hypothetical protein DFH08DRAFT_827896 [Mycena albidolilacea]